MGYSFPMTMTKKDITLVCRLRHGDTLTIQRHLRGKWKDEVVTYNATTRFALHVRTANNLDRVLKWADHDERWRFVQETDCESSELFYDRSKK